MSHKEEVWEEFKAEMGNDLHCLPGLDPRINELINEAMFIAWVKAHAKYAPKWLPIDDKAKTGWTQFVLVEDFSSKVAYWDGLVWVDYNSKKTITQNVIGYTPIPDATEN